MQTVLRLCICVDQAQRFCHAECGIRFKLVFVHTLAALGCLLADLREHAVIQHTQKKLDQSLGTEVIQIK